MSAEQITKTTPPTEIVELTFGAAMAWLEAHNEMPLRIDGDSSGVTEVRYSDTKKQIQYRTESSGSWSNLSSSINVIMNPGIVFSNRPAENLDPEWEPVVSGFSEYGKQVRKLTLRLTKRIKTLEEALARVEARYAAKNATTEAPGAVITQDNPTTTPNTESPKRSPRSKKPSDAGILAITDSPEEDLGISF